MTPLGGTHGEVAIPREKSGDPRQRHEGTEKTLIGAGRTSDGYEPEPVGKGCLTRCCPWQ